ncbi:MULTISPECIES: tetratricopeptide repeat protein [Cyanophyceae]|uniref:tetratricopeptide repeat protein n=1 Tax=Cyanophyceae TaxID=3028117 RepID=UPI001686DE32|nr:tetratricopeptide repeat protein [Trichocoleus sp. FACHB-40]MBD2003666.1 hypothetical protein [Trichocoleus sp. FACHB-40]
MTEQVNDLFDIGLERYKAGEGPDTLIPVFKEICDRSPKTNAAWVCLSWLYLLDNNPSLAAKAAQKAVKLNPADPQARINLAIAMLETGQKGVRQHVEVAGRAIAIESELREDVEESIADGFSRKPDWDSLTKVKNWLFA